MNWILTLVLMVAGLSAHAAAEVAAGPLPPVPSASGTASLWRRVLAMTDEEREAFIAKKPATVQPYLRQKAQEYLALSPADRERRLQALEMRAQMLQMMRLPLDLRRQELEKLPEAMRREIARRLILWDPLPPALQKDVLENETVARLLAESQVSGIPRSNLVAKLSPQGREEMEKNLERWDNLPEAQQEQIINSVKSFFDQDPKARSQTLGELAESDRARLTPTLAALDRMSREQRDTALEGFRKFKQLPREEQQQFLLKAQRWEGMSAKEKQIWRKVVASLPQPPLPYPPSPSAAVQAISIRGTTR